MWEAKVFAAADETDTADAAEMNCKHKVTPGRGDIMILIKES